MFRSGCVPICGTPERGTGTAVDRFAGLPEACGLPGLRPGPRTRGHAPSPLRGFTLGPPETASGSWDLEDGMAVLSLDSDEPTRPRIPSRRRRLGGSPGRWSADPGPPATHHRGSCKEQFLIFHRFPRNDLPGVPVPFDLSEVVQFPYMQGVARGQSVKIKIDVADSERRMVSWKGNREWSSGGLCTTS